MAIRPDFDIGTVTLTSGSADFTTSGSALEVAKVSAGDAIITPSGHVLIIATVTGQNSGTLFLPCPAAAAGTDLPLRIRFQPDGSRYQGAVRNLIDLLSSGNLEAFAALVGSAGLVPIFTGVGTMDLADPATFGIQDPNDSLGKLAALTLGNRQILQTDATGALKTLALVANKFLRTDGNGDLALSDLGAAAIALLNLSGTAAADRLPYLTGTSGGELTPFTALARSILAGSTGAAMFASMGAASGFANGGSWLRLPNNWILQMGTFAGSADAAGVLSISLPTSYTGKDNYKVVAWNGDYNITTILSYVRSAVWPATGGFAVRFRNPTTGTPDANEARRVDWIAIGY